ncbi:hypothetical protein ACMU_09745 [Actibacterium mucosum KCTC 23349]|uniref:Uncharacterized protein n=1 Tax=Actibacterium mucosum KCTC 23349 TaxID=1454373 RepID=A0A037ZHW7_9RHOB|nr:hypothetical protein [Actibacterium mucosum]KAJ56035.1 hypothetical protein ACMU_09745 [Actibacterium mucosum KCTC 23349]
MQIVYHLGVHFTDEERLLKCLLKNKGALANEGTAVPGPSRYRKLLRQTLFGLRGGPATRDQQQEILEAALEGEYAERIIFSAPNLLGNPGAMLRDGALYERAGERVASLCSIFPDAQNEFFIGLRNPATLLPVVPGSVEAPADFMQVLSTTDPRGLRWSDMVARIRGENPDVPLTIWCNEDTPLIWPQVLRELAAHDPLLALEGTNDFLASIMSREGMERMLVYMSTHPPATEVQRRRIVAAFLDKFAIPDEIEVELDLPGWDDALVDELTELYDEDVYQIEKMAGVNFIAP